MPRGRMPSPTHGFDHYCNNELFDAWARWRGVAPYSGIGVPNKTVMSIRAVELARIESEMNRREEEN